MAGKPTKLEKKLVDAIRDTGLSQSQLAKLAGVDQGALSRFLANDVAERRSLSLPTADRLCRSISKTFRPDCWSESLNLVKVNTSTWGLSHIG